MRVYELSKEINVPNKELVEYLSKSNSDIKTHSSSVSDAEAESARKYFATRASGQHLSLRRRTRHSVPISCGSMHVL